MKIEISIDRESKVYELKALSLFAESLASGRHIEEVAGAVPSPGTPKSGVFETGRVVNIGKSATFEPVVTEKVKEEPVVTEKAEEAVKDGPKDFEVMVEDALKMTEDEMKDVPTTVLVAALNTLGIDPTTRPGKNTNAKLRGLLISAIAEAEKEETAEETENAPEIKPQEEPEAPEDKSPETEPEEITIDMLRDIARNLIAANKRKVIAEAFEACGCSNFSTLKKQDYAKFYDLCKK